ncbi:MAG: bifunctional oligoribonuclease/PAP phosphatase NrnA [Flavobacteriales bacterium]|nr:bifunctional oligoribonuclease/PAP phosphatase NrnA [Flavobacteriales bacterium]
MSWSIPIDALAALRDQVSRPRRIAITTHHNPDGDAVGSSLGLAHLLRHAGHSVTVVFPNRPPAFLRWMPGYGDAIAWDTHAGPAMEALRGCELLFCLDLNRPDRVKELEPALLAAPFRVLIDHHRDPVPFTQVTFSDVGSCATAQMVADIAVAMGWQDAIGADAATCLYAGIMTDTGGFRYPATTSHTLRMAALLMERGAVPHQISSAILDDSTEERLRLLGFTLSERMQVLPELGAVVIHLERSDLDRFKYQPGDTEGLVNQGLAIRGIRLSAFFMERKDGIKVSLRSKGNVDVDRICRDLYDGGGHLNAAGGLARGGMEQVVERFIAELRIRMPQVA